MLSKEEALLKNKLYYLFISLILLGGFLYSQDPPEEFEFNQGYNQSFYFFINMDIAGESLDENDWIGAFKTYDETQF